MPKSSDPNARTNSTHAGGAGYAEQQPQSKSEAHTPPPAKPPESLDGGAERKHKEPNTLPDRTAENL